MAAAAAAKERSNNISIVVKKRKKHAQGEKVENPTRMAPKDASIRSTENWIMQKKHDNLYQCKEMPSEAMDENSILLLLRDAIVQHSALNDIKLILR
jgi:hypothetical protein